LFPIVIPISFVNQYPVIGLVAIVLFIVLSFKVFVEKEMIFFSEYSIFYWAIFVILLWTGVSLFRNFSFLSTFSIYDANFKIAAEDYLTILFGNYSFFLEYLLFKKREIPWDDVLKILTFYHFFCSYKSSRLFFNFSLPLLGGEFRYAEGDAKLGWNRIGGIDRCV